MAISSIDRVQQRAQVQQQLEAFQVQQRLSLFTASSFERTSAVKMGDGSQLAIPTMTSSDQAAMAALFGSVPTSARAELETLTTQFGEAIYNELANNPDCIKTGKISGGLEETMNLVATTSAGLTGGQREDPDAIQGVLFMGMMGIEQDVGNFARMVQGKTELAGEVRTDCTELRDAISDWPDDGSTQYFEWTEVRFVDGEMIVEKKSGNLTKEEAELKLGELEEQLGQLRDMTELDKHDLQKMTSDYQQAMNILTAMLKNMHDTQKAIIQNTKA